MVYDLFSYIYNFTQGGLEQAGWGIVSTIFFVLPVFIVSIIIIKILTVIMRKKYPFQYTILGLFIAVFFQYFILFPLVDTFL